MTDVRELIEAVRAAGAAIRADGTDLVIRPASNVPPDLKIRLRDRKPDLLAFLAQPLAVRFGDAQDSWEWIEERAAILESDCGMERDNANHQAFMLWYRRFVSTS